MPPATERDNYVPRLIDTKRMDRLRAHVAKYGEAVDNLPSGFRDEIALDFSECPHTTSTLVEIEGPHGYWGILICVNCGEAHAKECPHVRCDWVLDGKLLVCGQCGVDAT